MSTVVIVTGLLAIGGCFLYMRSRDDDTKKKISPLVYLAIALILAVMLFSCDSGDPGVAETIRSAGESGLKAIGKSSGMYGGYMMRGGSPPF